MRNALRIGKIASLLAASTTVVTVVLASCALPPLPARPGPATVEARNALMAEEVMQAERDANNASDMRGDYEAALKYFTEDFISIDPKY